MFVFLSAVSKLRCAASLIPAVPSEVGKESGSRPWPSIIWPVFPYSIVGVGSSAHLFLLTPPAQEYSKAVSLISFFEKAVVHQDSGRLGDAPCQKMRPVVFLIFQFLQVPSVFFRIPFTASPSVKDF